MTARLPPGWEASPAVAVDRLYSLRVAGGGNSRRHGVRGLNLLYGDIARLARTERLEEALDTFESDLQLYVAEEGRHRVFVHAGVVGWKGRAVVMPGRSMSGKSTLVAELVRAGATYYSDEFAVLDRRGRVHPFARPLSLRTGRAGRQRKLAVESLNGTSGDRPLTAGLIVVSEYREGARWRPCRLSGGRGLLALLANTISARRQPEVALDTLRQLAAHAPVLKGVRGEAKEVASLILESVERVEF